MRLHYWKAKHKNFGDELNSWIWEKYISFSTAENVSTVFLGIGTIIDSDIPDASRTIIFGSGAGYRKPPTSIHNDAALDISFTRGPLSARLLNLDPTKYITDPAILVADQFPKVLNDNRHGTVFVPHYKSTTSSRLREVCKRAGIEFVDPLSESRSIVDRISRARKVIAESMHAAIVADAMRVPWVPVVTSPEISTFKWCDFTFSLDLPYCPVVLPPTCLPHSIRNLLLRHSSNKFSLAEDRSNACFINDERGQLEQLSSFKLIPARQLSSFRQLVYFSARVFNRIASRLPAMLFNLNGRAYLAKSVAAMTACADMPGFLSDERIHQAALSRIIRALDQLQNTD